MEEIKKLLIEYTKEKELDSLYINIWKDEDIYHFSCEETVKFLE